MTQVGLFGSGPRFVTVTTDPPWPEHGGGQIKRGADRHYPLMPVKDIIALHASMLRQGGSHEAAQDAHLYLWVTNNYLPAGLETMAAAGFRYITNIVWAKMEAAEVQGETLWRANRAGLGQYFRGAHELCLFGVRGDGYAASKDIDPETVRKPFVSSLLPADRGRHSAKPESFRQLVERRSKGPYLEMFARGEAAPGWDVFGNEAIPIAQGGA